MFHRSLNDASEPSMSKALAEARQCRSPLRQSAPLIESGKRKAGFAFDSNCIFIRDARNGHLQPPL